MQQYMSESTPTPQFPVVPPVKRKYIGSGEDVPIGDELNDLIEMWLEEEEDVYSC